jgi:hypothetical protein
VRFSRRTHEHFLASDIDGEHTGWSAYWVDGAWVARVGKPEKNTGRFGRKKNPRRAGKRE